LKRAIAWFAENGVAANLLMLVLMVGGALALPRIKQEVFPEVAIEMVTVSVPYRGATPEEVEEGVCVRVEEAIQDVEGLKKLRSTAGEGMGVVIAELAPGVDVRKAVEDVKTRVDAISTFPVETEKPVVQQALLRVQVINVAISGDVDERTLRTLGQRVRDELVALPGLSHADLAAVRPYEISIEVDEFDLRRHGLTFDDVVTAVQRSSIDLPAGSLRTGGGEILLRTKGQAYRGRDFERLVLLSRADGTRLTLGEVATVVDGFEESDIYARFDGKPAALIQVFRVGEQSALDVAGAVRDYVRDARRRMPPGVTLETWPDDSPILRARLDTLLNDGWQGFALVMLALALFMEVRMAFWVGMGMPVAVLGALWFLPGLGVSINVLSLFAFLLVLGVLVDDAIVVGENVYTARQRGLPRLQAAISGAQEVATPVVFGVLCSMAAFTPLLLIPGAMGEFTATIPKVVITVLLVSLIETQFILPSHLGHIREIDPAARGWAMRAWKRVQDVTSAWLERLIHDTYAPFLRRALEWRYATLATGVATLILAFGLIGGGWTRFVFMPQIEADNVVAFLTMPQGTPVEVTAAGLRRLEETAEAVRREIEGEGRSGGVFRHVLTSIGQQPLRARQDEDRTGRVGAGRTSGNLGEVNIELTPSEERSVTSAQIARLWRAKTGTIPDAVELDFTSSLFDAGAPVEVQLQGTDVAVLRTAAEELKGRLASYPGVFDVSDSFRGGKQELKLSLKPSAETLGLSLADLARQVRQGFYGDEAQRIQRGRDDVRVMVRYPEADRRSLDAVETMRIRTPDGTEVPFSAVATVQHGRGFSSIERVDRERVIRVTADVDPSRTTPNEIVGDLEANVLPDLLARLPGLSYSLQGEQREQEEFLGAMGRNFGIALLLIYGLLAIPLKSYSQPFLIMSAIPFGMVGAIMGHALLGYDLSMFSVIGMVALSGVVVNDNLVLVDYVNQRRGEGESLKAAASIAGVARFRPIVLNSVTSFVGLLPLLLNRSVQAQFLIPMAIALSFGVLFSTLVTLLLVPSAYLVLDDLQGLAARRRAGATPSPGGEPIGAPPSGPGRADEGQAQVFARIGRSSQVR
jgi:multidrug efflux pump subunit AcrB